MSVVEHLEPAWTRAFLRRTRFLDADFQGDVLAVISMFLNKYRSIEAKFLKPCHLHPRPDLHIASHGSSTPPNNTLPFARPIHDLYSRPERHQT